MSYDILVFRGAQKTLAKLPKQDYQKVRTAIEDLAQTPRPIGWGERKKVWQLNNREALSNE